ncbi:Putative peptidoglycan binding domain-containing protein [Pelagibacterium luteolum]|uniref:Putative peptidoglycan binding domain-containing protein n=2 Tax=Pelagibacterium luteolum TaxID=440168 RepID=A0A1G7WG28_9HYPH|nr:Putative peptidoglycan binding domain-containing protein [Pelagibacterium luteolum]
MAGMSALAATAAFSAPAYSQSLFSNLLGGGRRVVTQEQLELNSRQAMDAIGGFDPIVSVDTEYNLQRVAEYYERLNAIGGWPDVPEAIFRLSLNSENRAVRDLRGYLAHTGDLSQDVALSDQFDTDVDAAVRGFQARHGLQINGQIDEFTYWAMKVPAATRLNQIKLNMERVRGLEGRLEDRYVNVNIPAAAIEAIASKQVARRHTAVVGKIDRQTPILRSRIHQINFNPYWTVPVSIIRRDIIGLVNNNPNYLNEYSIRIFDGSGREVPQSAIDWSTEEAVNYTFRQDPGAQNSMGNVKINFHNPHAVYLHDTPQQTLFSENARFHSSGCVRVANVADFVAWILQDSGYDIIGVNGAFASGERLDVSVSNPVPIFMTYFTAWANRNGVVSFRDDVYEYDAQGKIDFPEISA